LKKTLTYLDAGVVIAAVAGKLPLSDLALDIITDPARSLVVSSLLTLETLPSALYLRDRAQAQALNDIIASADLRVSIRENLVDLAVSEASKILGIRAIDALHLTAAKFAGADELITTEKPTKPLYKARGIKVTQFP